MSTSQNIGYNILLRVVALFVSFGLTALLLGIALYFKLPSTPVLIISFIIGVFAQTTLYNRLKKQTDHPKL